MRAHRWSDLCRRGVTLGLTLVLCTFGIGAVVGAAPTGVLRVAARADMTTLDPASAIDYQTWIAVEQMFNGLYNFDRDGRTYPDLAQSLPTISPDGLTYTVTLRKGVRFHNGREVQADDVKYSLERVLTPSVKSWGQRFLTAIDGAKDVLDGKAAELRGVKVIDRYTVQIRLTEPQGVFTSNLGTSPAFVVPRDIVQERGAGFSRNPVGTGPYRFVAWTPGQRFSMERNSAYFVRGVPHIDRVDYSLGVDPSVAFLQLTRGDTDFLADGIPSADYPQVVNDPHFRPLVGSGRLYITHWLGPNVTMKPFNDVRVRQALAFAIDKDRLIRLLRGEGVRTDGFLPPGVPGYNVARPRQPYSPQKAKELLAAAGYANGFKSELYYRSDSAVEKTTAESIQQDLGAVGIQVELRPLTNAAYSAEVAKPGTVPLGLIAKGANYPDPFDFLSLPTCVNARPGTRYPSYYCNPKYDDLITRAETLGANPPARIATYRQAEDLLLSDMPQIFLYNDVKNTLHSRRVQGFYVHPIFLWWWRDYNLSD